MDRSEPASTTTAPPLEPPPRESPEIVRRLEARVRELEAIERRYQSLIDQMPDMIVRVDRDLRYVDINQRFCEIFSVSCEELVGQALGTVRPEVGMPWVAIFQSTLVAREAREVAFAFDAPTGRRWFETRLVPELSATGDVVSVLAVARDVTDRRESELALQASEARLRLLMDQSPAVLWSTDLELRYTSLAGAAIAGITGITRALIGEPLSEKINASDDDTVMVAHRQALAGQAVEYDFHFGSRDFRSRVEPLRDPQGDIIGTIGVALDVTDLKRAEEGLRQLNAVLEARVEERTSELDRALSALTQSEAMFRALLEQMPDGLYVTELEDRDPALRIILANEAAARMLGRQPDDLIGESLLGLCADHKTAHETADQLERLRRGEIVRVEGHFRRAHGPEFPVELTARLVQYGGRRVAMGLVRDVTERHAREAQLRLIQSAVDQVTDAVIITDADFNPPGPRIIYVNPAFEEMTGYTADEALGQSPRILQGPDSDRATLKRVRDHLARGEAFDGEILNYRKDGTPYYLAWHMAPIRNDAGEVINWVAIERNITEQKRQAEVHRQHLAELAHVSRLSMMGEMASGLAHELNQPLAAIANYARGSLRRMDKQDVADPPLRDALDRIAAQAERSGQIIQRLRQFVRKRELQRSLTDVNTLVREAMTLIEPELKHRRAEVVFKLDPKPLRILLDPIQIEQVLLNLVRNAAESMAETPAPERQITLATRTDEDGVRIDVTDRGPGLDQAELDRVFDPFYTTKAHGMGMGLTISRTIIEAHGGRLTASRNRGRGLTFSMYLPRLPGGRPAKESKCRMT